MAIFSLRVQSFTRSAGRSVVAAAAYRSGESLADNRLGQDFDFTGKRANIAHTAIIAPENAPPEFQDREALWNAVEKAERRKDALPAREILVALPHELSDEQRRELVEDFARESLAKRGVIADIAIHYPGKEGDERNHHAHIMVTSRTVGPEGLGPKSREWTRPELIKDIRREWAEATNRHLERHAPHVEKVSEKTLAEQGVERAPTQHKGPEATAMERRGERTDRGENNRDIQAQNTGREREAKHLDRQVRDDFRDGKWVERSTDDVIRNMQATRDTLARQRDGWQQEREGIKVPRAASVRKLEAELTRKEAAAHRRALQQEEEAKKRAHADGVSLKKIAFWHSNPAQAAMQQIVNWNKNLDRISQARAESERTKKELEERRAWTKSPDGKAHIQNLRQPDIDAQKAAKTQQRTLDRKIKRMGRRIDEADDAIVDTKVAKRLGIEKLRVPAEIPTAQGRATANARRFFNYMGTEARISIGKAPEPERNAAIKFVKGLAPGAPVPSVYQPGPSLSQTIAPGRPGPAKGPELPDF